ncbi:MAG: YdeI/OmpD-associated family protein [Cryomorphaceae bacterium]|nr:YdeI/OmpD-associated family protein [Cryomorphaceae bacterium]
MNPEVNELFKDAPRWNPELNFLRALVLQAPLVEEVKWGQPCYTHEGRNIAILGGFKNYFVLSLMKGALIPDPQGLLSKPGPNSVEGRWMKFTSVAGVEAAAPYVLDFLLEAIKAEELGLRVEKPANEFVVPAELEAAYEGTPGLREAFEALTVGRQRAYLMFFTAAKQSATVSARIEKFTPRILRRKGMIDCVCGHSKKMPGCDGSHKNYPGTVTC